MSAPRLGQTIHYMARGSADGVFPPVCRAAMVTEVHDEDLISLVALNPTGMFFHAEPLPHSEAKEGGTWHYPCVPDRPELRSV